MTLVQAAPASRGGQVLLIGPILVAGGLLPVSAYLSGVFDGIWSWDDSAEVVVFSVHNLLPSLLLALLISLTSRRMAKGMPVLALGTAVFVAGHVFGLLNLVFDPPYSTNGLVILFLPFFTGSFVVCVALVTWLLHVLRSRLLHPAESFPH